MTPEQKLALFRKAAANVESNWDKENDCPKGMEYLKNKKMTDGEWAIDFVTYYKQEHQPALIAALKVFVAENRPLEKERVLELAKGIYLQDHPDSIKN